jgi:CMP-2-keto-3-deoxyoctulosonic acid synthetase
VFDSNYLKEYLQHPNTPCQLSEDIEWLKIIEMGYKIRSYCVKESEIGINTPEDYQYLLDKYQN